MISDKKIREVKSQIARGKPAGEVWEEMKLEGYSREDIQRCIEVKKKDMRSWFLVTGILFLLGALVFSAKEERLMNNISVKLFSIAGLSFIKYYWPVKKKQYEEMD